MYLKLQKGSMEPQMREMCELVLRIFKYLSTAKKLNCNSFRKALKPDGEWLMAYYQDIFPMLKELIQETQAERQKIYQALQSDMQFEKAMNNNSFAMAEKNLLANQRQKVKALILYLYENLFYNGKAQVKGVPLSYHAFKEGMFNNNSKTVCPACLAHKHNLNKEGDVDHYLPKVKYPGLIFHPLNLAVLCKDCNSRTLKGEKDPLQYSNLTEIYFPYLRAAEEETKLAVVGTGGNYKMTILPTVSPAQEAMVKKRIENLDNLFKLKERWTESINDCIDEEAISLKKYNTWEEAKQALEEDILDTKDKAVDHKHRLIDVACLEFMYGDGIDIIKDDWQRRQEEKKKMR